jgi:hypothetical protein
MIEWLDVFSKVEWSHVFSVETVFCMMFCAVFCECVHYVVDRIKHHNTDNEKWKEYQEHLRSKW